MIGFMPSFDVLSQGYPFLEAIYSHLKICDDIYILDASKDATLKILRTFKNKRIHVYHTKLESTYSKNGEIIKDMSNKLLKIIKNGKTGKNYIFYFQANEIIHENSYKFLSKILDRYPNYNSYLLYYYELFGRYLFGEQFRLRLVKLTNSTRVIGDGWALNNSIVDINYIKSVAHNYIESIKAKQLCDCFYTIYNRYRFIYSPNPVYRYSRIFPYNTILKLKTHKKVFNQSYFSKLKLPNKYKSADEFFKELCKSESIEAKKWRREFPECQKIGHHPKIMQEILDKPRYYVRDYIIDLINNL
ncbi:MAG: hypothetical protein LVQ97_05245 [Candidatus Micrarchaeales archaeon]|nr:hypothetical protein [Candidatus Micrarchaeales archaeon]